MQTFVLYCESYAGHLVQRDGAVVSNPASREFARFAFLCRSLANDFALSPGAIAIMARVPEPAPPGGPNRILG